MKIFKRIEALVVISLVCAINAIAQTISVTAPNGGESAYVGKVFAVRWTSSGLSSSFVKLEYSANNGAQWNLIESGVNNTGTYNWTVPSNVSSQCLLRVSDYGDATVNDVSDAVFSIKQPFITITSPNGGESLTGCATQTITWTQGGVRDYVSLYYSYDGGINWIYVGDDYIGDNSNTYSWPVPSVASNKFRVKVAGYYESNIKDSSDANFTVVPPANALQITSPNGGESFSASSFQQISWTTTGTIGNVSLRYSVNKGLSWDWVRGKDGNIANNIANTGSFNWLVPSVAASGNCIVQLYETNKTCNLDYSDNFFTIDNSPSISVTYPFGGEKYMREETILYTGVLPICLLLM